jgi:hypothetical protein
MLHWPFPIGLIFGSPINLQAVDFALRDIFAPLKASSLHKHLDLVASHHYNCLEADELKNTFTY